MNNLQYTPFDIANLTAKWLIDIGAVNFRADPPFEFTSGRHSPIYVDVRRICGETRCRNEITMMACNLIYREIGAQAFSVVAGGETAGIPIAAWIADRLHKPMCYVRKTPKGFGRGGQIEGLSDEQLAIGRKFMLIEDLCTDGGSKQVFTDAIRKSGNICTDIMVVYSYGIFGADEILAKEGCRLTPMTSAATLLAVADDLDWSTREVRDQVRRFIDAPDAWAS